MDYNALKRKYTPNREPEQPEVVPVTVPVEPDPVVEEVPPVLPEVELPPVQPVVKRPAPPPVRTPVHPPETPDDVGNGFFLDDSGEVITPDPPPHSPGVPSLLRNLSLDRLAYLPWLDIIMILLTVCGIIWVIANFDAVTVIIAAAIGKLLQSVIGLLMIVAVIVGLVLILSRRRWRYI